MVPYTYIPVKQWRMVGFGCFLTAYMLCDLETCIHFVWCSNNVLNYFIIVPTTIYKHFDIIIIILFEIYLIIIYAAKFFP